MDYTNNKTLFLALKIGDEKAFEFLYKKYYPRLQRYALRFVENEESASDIVQECFLRFYEKREDLTDESMQSLLFTMVRNACLNHLRHIGLINFRRLDFLEAIEGEERLYYVDFSEMPDKELMIKELKEQIQYVISQLPKRRQEIFIMSRIQNKKNKEIADILQISTTAVEAHISKALSAFSQYFKTKYPIGFTIIIFISTIC